LFDIIRFVEYLFDMMNHSVEWITSFYLIMYLNYLR